MENRDNCLLRSRSRDAPDPSASSDLDSSVEGEPSPGRHQQGDNHVTSNGEKVSTSFVKQIYENTELLTTIDFYMIEPLIIVS